MQEGSAGAEILGVCPELHAPLDDMELADRRHHSGLSLDVVVRVIDGSELLVNQVHATWGIGSSNGIEAWMMICWS